MVAEAKALETMCRTPMESGEYERIIESITQIVSKRFFAFPSAKRETEKGYYDAWTGQILEEWSVCCHDMATNKTIAHYDLRFLKPLDEDLLHEIGKKFSKIITVEDGVRNGGMGSAIMEWMSDHGYQPVIRRLGLPDHFVEHGKVSELQAIVGIDKESIIKAINEISNPKPQTSNL